MRRRTQLQRRKLLSSLAAASLGGISSAMGFRSRIAYAGAQASQLDPLDQDDLYTIFRKLNYTFDDRLVFWYIEAVRNALVDSQFTPFWNMHVGFISSIRDLDENRYEVKTLRAIFYSDLSSGSLLKTFDNPFTGERVSVPQPQLRVATQTYNKVGIDSVRAPRPGMTMEEYGHIGPAWVIGDDVWCRGDTGFRAEPTGNEGRLLQVNDWETFHGSIREVSDPDVMSANATLTFNDINTWPAWLNMGEHPGNYVSRGFGRKNWSIEGMPDIWRTFMRAQHPEVYKEPRAYIDA